MYVSEQIISKINEVRKEKEITIAELARLANMAQATVTKILNGSTPNPTIESVAPLTTALGISIDRILGIKTDEATPAPVVTALDTYAELLKEKDERISDLKEEQEKMRKEKKVFAIALACVVGFLLLLLTIDVTNGHFGYFRY